MPSRRNGAAPHFSAGDHRPNNEPKLGGDGISCFAPILSTHSWTAHGASHAAQDSALAVRAGGAQSRSGSCAGGAAGAPAVEVAVAGFARDTVSNTVLQSICTGALFEHGNSPLPAPGFHSADSKAASGREPCSRVGKRAGGCAWLCGQWPDSAASTLPEGLDAAYRRVPFRRAGASSSR